MIVSKLEIILIDIKIISMYTLLSRLFDDTKKFAISFLKLYKNYIMIYRFFFFL